MKIQTEKRNDTLLALVNFKPRIRKYHNKVRLRPSKCSLEQYTKKQSCLEIGIEQSEGPQWIEILDGLDEVVPSERGGCLIRGLDAKAGPRVKGLNEDDTVGMQPLVPDSDGLKKGLEKNGQNI